MQKSEFTLKGHKQLLGMDGYVYDGTLLHNGKPVCRYHDQGCGGGMMLHFTDKKIENEFNTFIKTLPNSEPCKYFPDGVEPSADSFIEDIIIAQETAKKLARAAKTKTIFRCKGDPTGDFRTLSGGAYSESSKKWLKDKFGDKLAEVYQNGAWSMP